jgi:undecaprenyl-diphosphatase
MPFETSLLSQVTQLHRPWLDDLMLLASALGAGGFIWIIIGSITGIFPKHTAAMFRLWLAVAITFEIVDDVSKKFVPRDRPFETIAGMQLIDARPGSPSFPSNHSAMAAAGALALTRMMPAGGWIFWPLALVIAFSRVYLGLHWPTDVLGGLILGFAVAWFVLGGKAPPRHRDAALIKARPRPET